MAEPSETAVEDRPAAAEESPHLEEHERTQAGEIKPATPRVIHEVLREEGEIELRRPLGALIWSGLAAGLTMGFSFLTLALLHAALGDAPSAKIIAPLGYTVGFLIVAIGKQQLFTETTLTATLPLMHAPSADGLRGLARVWLAVLAANIAGTIAFAALLAAPGVMRPEVAHALTAAAQSALGDHFLVTATRAVLAGWLIALMVWLIPGSGAAAPFIIVALTYIVGLGEFPHIIAGSTEAAYAVIVGHATIVDYLWRFFAPTLIGNVVGGTALAAVLNHAPVAHDFAARRKGD